MSKRGRRYGHRPDDVIVDEAVDEPTSGLALPQPRHLRYAHGAPEKHAGVMILVDNTNQEIVNYRCSTMFNRVQRYGRWYRLQGQDRATGECIYTPEVVLL